MCVVSMVGEHYNDKWKPFKYHHWPAIEPWPDSPKVPYPGARPIIPVDRVEFDDLKKQVEEMIALMKRAKKYDEDNNEPDCEVDEKMDLLRKVAKLVGVDLDKEVGLKT